MSWRHALVVVTFLLPVSAVGACSDPPAKPAAGGGSIVGGSAAGGGGNAEGGADGGTDASGFDAADGGVCNDLVASGLVIDRIGVAGEPPAGRGGTIVDGEYNLTDYTVFTGAGGAGGPTGITAKAVLRIAAGRLDELYELGGSGNPSVRSSSSTYGATAATFAITEQCPQLGAGATLQYTANDPLLILTNPATKEAFTFTKR
jgi:hypothetical protein